MAYIWRYEKMVKKEKVVEFRLEKHTTVENGGSIKETFVFKPSGDVSTKEIMLRICAEDAPEVLGGLGLPQSIGDTVDIGFGATNKQAKL
jgi:hypothetical protein